MYSVQIAVSDGTLARISLSIEYFEKDDITLYRNLETTPLVLGTDWQWDGDTAINLLTGIPLPGGEYITIRRNTNIDRAFNIYDGGAAFSRDTLDENFRQMIYLAQEFTEGNGLTGLFFPLDMHGFKITNLGDGTNPKDAVNKGQLDVVDDRVTNLEQSFVVDTISYPWYTITTSEMDTFNPPFSFNKCTLAIDGVTQTPGYSYIVVDNQILLAEPVPVGTMVFARLGEDVGLDPDYATADQLAAAIVDRVAEDAALQTQVDSKAAKGVNSDITQITGLTTPLSTAQGGTGNNTGTALTATKLATARALQVALGSTTAASFDGTADVSPGVSGTLPLANGGTGATAAPAARTNLGSGTTGDAVFVASTPLAGRNALQAATYIGVVDGSPASAGNVGEVLTAVSASPVALTSGVAANVTSLALTPGIWEVTSIGQSIPAGGGSSGGVSAGLSTVSATLPTNWYEVYTRGYSVNGTATTSLPTRMFNITTNTTVYCVVNLTFSGGTYTARGTITARRIR